MSGIDEQYIKRCFSLAQAGTGAVSPNPLVGAVIVKEGRIISEGGHEYFGGPHAEANAINKSPESVEGADLYCNLEPCCHTGKKTPPCVPLIIKNKIKRVVISNIDPNPEVAGKGIAQLRDNGIEVVTGVCREEGNYLNRFFFKFVTTGLPYVTIKIAQSADGKISAGEGVQTWITGEESAKFVHSQRSVYDAVLVGANTVITDNPQLNVRYAAGRDPKRIIVDGSLRSPLESKVFTDGNKNNTLLFTSDNAETEKIKILENAGVRVFVMPSVNGKFSFKEMLEKIGTEKISSLFIEGGAQIFTQFIESHLFDELIILKSAKILGKGINALNCEFPQNLIKIEEIYLDDDKKIVYLLKN